jgi:hypothetical protein
MSWCSIEAQRQFYLLPYCYHYVKTLTGVGVAQLMMCLMDGWVTDVRLPVRIFLFVTTF